MSDDETRAIARYGARQRARVAVEDVAERLQLRPLDPDTPAAIDAAIAALAQLRELVA